MDKNNKSKPTRNKGEGFSHDHSKKEIQALKAMLPQSNRSPGFKNPDSDKSSPKKTND